MVRKGYGSEPRCFLSEGKISWMKVVVVGAGIVGTSTAYHLACKGADVFLVDRKDEGQATAAGAGIVCPWLSKRRSVNWYHLARAGARYYATLISQLEEDGETGVGYARVGALAVSRDSDEMDAIEERARQKRIDAPEVGEISRLNAHEARHLFPPLHEELSAVHITGAARVDGRLLSNALKRAARKRGVKERTGEAQLEVNGAGVTGVRVNGERVRADAVVVAAGAWSAQLLRPFQVKLPVEPQRGQIVHLRLPGTDTSRWPVVLPESSHYLLAFDDSRIVVGATREDGSGFDYRVTAGGLEEVLREALTVAPGLADGTVHDIRVGFRPMSLSRLPLIGLHPDIPGLVVATGMGPTGLTIGPYAGKLAASLALGEEPEVDLEPFNPFRTGGQ